MVGACACRRRERAERLFGVRIRLEIYTPAHRREHGYYVLPLLLGDGIAARVDLKSDRTANALRVQAAHSEPGVRAEVAATALATAVRGLADWLCLSDIVVAERGDLSGPLARALA